MTVARQTQRLLIPLALLALLVLGVFFVFGQSNTALASSPPVVDGFVQDPVTGVVEAQYVANGITYTVDSGTGTFAGLLFTAEDDQKFHFAFAQSVLINDNSYGADGIGWGFKRKGHGLKDLLNSEHIKVKLFDSTDALKLEFYLDYASDADPKGNLIALPIDSLGVAGGDGAMIVGSPADILAASSSLDWNFNRSTPPSLFTDRLNDSPTRVPTNTFASIPFVL